MIKKLLKSLALSISCIALIISSPVSANGGPNNSTLNMMGKNGIYYYNPVGDCISGDYTGIVSGNDNEAKIWNYFVSAGINGISNNPAAIAGIMGNLKVESGYNPFAVSGSGIYYGLYQSNSSSMISAVNNAVGNSYWRSTNAPESINDKALKIELDFLINDQFSSGNRFKSYINSVTSSNLGSSADSARIYAELFMVAVERCIGGSDPLTSSEAKALAISLGIGQYANSGWQGTTSRRNEAATVYAKYANSTPTDNINISTTVCSSDGSNHSPYTGTDFPQYFQCDSRWGKLMYGPDGIKGPRGATICESGCGPTSFAMMATVLLKENILPDEVANVAGKLGMHAQDRTGAWVGSSWAITRTLANHYGLQYQDVNTCDINTINQYLRNGWMLHTSGTGSAPFTSNGHYIGIVGLNDAGEWYIANSAGKNNANRYYSPSVVISSGMKCNNVRAIKK